MSTLKAFYQKITSFFLAIIAVLFPLRGATGDLQGVTVTVPEENAHPNEEVDSWQWFTLEDARKNIRPGSLAEAFLDGYLDGGDYHFPEL